MDVRPDGATRRKRQVEHLIFLRAIVGSGRIAG
jgi:hypothetical protein